jgi:hypothetical protein
MKLLLLSLSDICQPPGMQMVTPTNVEFKPKRPWTYPIGQRIQGLADLVIR